MNQLRERIPLRGRCSGQAEKRRIIFHHTASKIRFFVGFVTLLILCLPRPLAARNQWDDVLDRYETICERCLDLRARVIAGEAVKDRELAGLLKEFDRLKQTLQAASGSMSRKQKERFAAIQRRYAAALGAVPTAKQEAPSPPPVRKAAPAVPVPKAQASDPPGAKASPAPAVPVRPDIEPLARPQAIRTPALPVPPAPAVTLERTAREHPAREQMTAPAAAGDGWSFILLAQAGWSQMQPSFGASLFVTPAGSPWGAYVCGRSNFTRTGSAYSCTAEGELIGSGRFWGNGASRYGVTAVTAGVAWHCTRHVSLYAGAGYGREELDWQDVGLEWAKVTGCSRTGLCPETGVLLRFGPLGIQFGCSLVAAPCVQFGCGIRF